MEAFLRVVLPRLLPAGRTFAIHVFQGKRDLLKKLPGRLRGYRHWLPADWRLIVMVDRDDDNCLELKARLETSAQEAELLSPRTKSPNRPWQVVNRVVIEELEAWYFGDWQSVCAAYPRVKPTIPRRTRYRDPDAIPGGTWEAFERVLQRSGYFKTGLRKVEAAQTIAAHFDPDRNRSRSFAVFHTAVREAMA